MTEAELRRVLLVKAFEEADAEGTLLPRAERAAASHEARRAVSERTRAGALQERLLVARADGLLPRIAARQPAATALARLPRWLRIDATLAVAGLLAGLGLSALDGRREIDILALPVAGFLAWNLLVYLVLAIGLLRRRREPGPVRQAISRMAQKGGAALAAMQGGDVVAARARGAFNAEWQESGMGCARHRVARALHVGAIATALGLIVGLYLRGLVFEYRAGWESTFLDAPRVHAIASLFYAPATWLTGVGIPAPEAIEALRFRDGAGGGDAAPWIHLLAATIAIVAIAPRLLLACAAMLRAWRCAAAIEMPATLARYFRRAFAGIEGVIPKPVVTVIPYVQRLPAGAVAQLAPWLAAQMEGDVELRDAGLVGYGEEDRAEGALGAGPRSDAVLVVLPLAATPEAETHGRLVRTVRDLAAKEPASRLLVVVDESDYARRMASAPERVDERRGLWSRFLAEAGVTPHFLVLAR